MKQRKRTRIVLSVLSAVVACAAVANLVNRSGLSIPGAALAETRSEAGPPPVGKEYATFAAGCFWSMQAIFQQLKGVERVDPGYAGGKVPHPSYEQVETGNTGYAESVNILFDPRVISYRELLQVLLTARDPTTLDRQGPDQGTQYRSVIFYRTPEQKRIALEAIRQVEASHVWRDPIVTTVNPFTTFYRAEDYHLDYYRRHPDEPYCRYVIAPEIEHFHKLFGSKLKAGS